MKLTLLGLTLLVFVLAACLEIPQAPPVPTATAEKVPTLFPVATPRPTRTPEPTAQVKPTALRVYDQIDGTVTGWLESGQVVTVLDCTDNYCRIRTDVLTGWVFRGCLTDNPAGLGCSAK